MKFRMMFAVVIFLVVAMVGCEDGRYIADDILSSSQYTLDRGPVVDSLPSYVYEMAGETSHGVIDKSRIQFMTWDQVLLHSAVPSGWSENMLKKHIRPMFWQYHAYDTEWGHPSPFRYDDESAIKKVGGEDDPPGIGNPYGLYINIFIRDPENVWVEGRPTFVDKPWFAKPMWIELFLWDGESVRPIYLPANKWNRGELEHRRNLLYPSMKHTEIRQPDFTVPHFTEPAESFFHAAFQIGNIHLFKDPRSKSRNAERTLQTLENILILVEFEDGTKVVWRFKDVYPYTEMPELQPVLWLEDAKYGEKFRDRYERNGEDHIRPENYENMKRLGIIPDDDD